MTYVVVTSGSDGVVRCSAATAKEAIKIGEDLEAKGSRDVRILADGEILPLDYFKIRYGGVQVDSV